MSKICPQFDGMRWWTFGRWLEWDEMVRMENPGNVMRVLLRVRWAHASLHPPPVKWSERVACQWSRNKAFSRPNTPTSGFPTSRDVRKKLLLYFCCGSLKPMSPSALPQTCLPGELFVFSVSLPFLSPGHGSFLYFQSPCPSFHQVLVTIQVSVQRSPGQEGLTQQDWHHMPSYLIIFRALII